MTEPPTAIRKAEKMLNNPWDYRDQLKHNLPNRPSSSFQSPTARKEDPACRIEAKAEELKFKDQWVLYIVWDDSEPLTARFLVHQVIRECGLQTFVASGSDTNYHPDRENNERFPVPNPDMCFLKVAPTGTEIRYVCERCDDSTGKSKADLNLSFSVE